MKTFGSQDRKTLEEAGYSLVSSSHDDKILKLENAETGDYEIFSLADDHAGWVVEYKGKGYKFVSSYTP